MSKVKALLTAAVLGAWCVAALQAQETTNGPTLRQAAKGKFLIGAAIRPDQVSGAIGDLIAAQFDSVTAENAMKPADLQPRPGEFNFGPADAIVDFAQKHGITVIGHNLCWHNQTPAWFFQNADGTPLPREKALANLKAHITAVVTHYKGKIRGWDVVNEALSDNDKDYLRDTPARKAIGDDYIVQVFKLAHEADPDIELYYNDYNIDFGEKMKKAVRLIGELKAAGCRVDGVGSQSHWQLNWPSAQDIETGITTLAGTGVKVHVTELDIDTLPRKGQTANITDVEKASGGTEQDPYVGGLPNDVQEKLAARYATVFGIFKKHQDKVARVTLWGVDDGMSWLNGFPVRGRTNHPLLFDRKLQPKPAYASVVKALKAE